MDRRSFLATTAAAGFGLWQDPAAAAEAWRGEPFSDGTFFDDGTGWVE